MKAHDSGYAILKKRYNEELREHKALETKYLELQSTIEKQHTRISELVAERQSIKEELDALNKEIRELFKHMGLFRRWTWRLKHK